MRGQAEQGSSGTIHDLIARGDVRPVYQPLVDLATGDVVGFEALARGPEGSDLERPDQLFAAAREAGVVGELDWVCKTAAVRGAVEAKLRPPLALFINSEPDAAGALMSPEFAESWASAKHNFLRLIFEITERAITGAPADLLRSIDYVRSLGWGVALDDVGADPHSLALLPYIRPDVIKLDKSVVQNPLDRDLGELILAVHAEAERSGALILAEGIETEEHLEVAKRIGAEFGQGWLFARPGPLPETTPKRSEISVTSNHTAFDALKTPFDILKNRARVRTVGERELWSTSRLLEARAQALPYSPVVLAAFQSAARLTSRTKMAYERLAESCPFVVALGEGMSAEPVPGVRGVALESDDPLAREWIVSVVSPYSAIMLCARERDDADDNGRMFDVVVTFKRDLVVEASTALLARIIRPRANELANRGRVEFATAMAEALASSEDAKATARPLLEVMAALTGLESTFLSKVTDDDYEILVSENRGDLDVREGANLPWTEAICKTALAEGRQAYDDVQAEMPNMPAASAEMGFRTFVTCPVVIKDGKIVGTLCGASTLPGGISEDALNVVRSFARLLGERLGSEVSV